MERFRGQVLRLGQVVLEDVAGLLIQHTGPDGAPLWCADFEVPFGYCLGRGEYELVLDDGWSGRILITHISSDSHRCRVARFEAPAGLRERGTAPSST